MDADAVVATPAHTFVDVIEPITNVSIAKSKKRAKAYKVIY